MNTHLFLAAGQWRRCAESAEDIPDGDLSLVVRALYHTEDPGWTRAVGWRHVRRDAGMLGRNSTVLQVRTEALPPGAPVSPPPQPPQEKATDRPVQRLTLQRDAA